MTRPPRRLVEGDRVYLARPRPSDADEYLALVRSSRTHLRPWMDLKSDRAGFDALLRRARGANRESHFVRRSDDDAILGAANLSDIVRGAFQNAFLGYWIGARFAGNGYMTDALALVLDRAFGELKLHRVEANVQPGNAKSIAVVERLGFRDEGLARRYLKIGGRWRDHVHYVMLAEEWKALRGKARTRGRQT